MSKKILLIEELEQKNLIKIAKEYCLNGFDIVSAYKTFISKSVYKTDKKAKERSEIISEYTEFKNYIEDFKGDIKELYRDTTIETISKLREIILNEYYEKYDVIKDTKTLEHKDIKYKSSIPFTDKLRAIETLIKLSKLVEDGEEDKDTNNTIFNFYTKDLNKKKK